MSMIDIFLPWIALSEARKDRNFLLQEAVALEQEVRSLMDKVKIADLRIAFFKKEIVRLKKGPSATQPRTKNGRFASKKSCGSSAEAPKETSAKNS